MFRREGDDLHLTLPVAVHEAALGARSTSRRPTDRPACGFRRARRPASGSAFAAAALSRRVDGRRGDLVVEVRIALPRLLDERSKELLREFGRINGTDDVREPMTSRHDAERDKGRAS